MVDTQVNQTGNGGGNGRSGLYALLAIIIALMIVAIILFLPRADDGTRDIDADIRIEAPDLPDRDDGEGAGQGTTPPNNGNANP